MNAWILIKRKGKKGGEFFSGKMFGKQNNKNGINLGKYMNTCKVVKVTKRKNMSTDIMANHQSGYNNTMQQQQQQNINI